MDLGLNGKVALVLAASKGLGRASAEALAREGALLAIGARTSETLNTTAREIQQQTGSKVIAVPSDVTKPEDIAHMISKTLQAFGRIDILVNNAGGPPPGDFARFDDAQWQAAFELTLFSTVRIIRQVLPHLREQKSGRIINIMSTSVKQPIDGLLLSNTLRSGVVGLSKSLASELAAENITVNTVCPGRILTDRLRQIYQIDEKIQQGASEQEVLSALAQDIPMRRPGRPAELGALVAFLASEQAAYITGTTIQVDGGLVRSLL